MKAEEKGKTKVLSVVKVDKIEPMEDPVVMPNEKRTIEKKEERSPAGRSKNKEKRHKDEYVKAKRKRRACRKFHVTESPLGEKQDSYILKGDLTSRKM